MIVETAFESVLQSFRHTFETFKNVLVYICGKSLGWCLTLLVIMLLVHVENLKGMKTSLVQVLWTSICIVNLVFSNFSGHRAAKARILFQESSP